MVTIDPLKRKEAKTLTFTYSDDVTAQSITDSTLTFVLKRNINDIEALITKNDDDFDKSQASSKIVTCELSADDTDIVGNFVAELKTVFSSTNIDKSETIYITINESITN